METLSRDKHRTKPVRSWEEMDRSKTVASPSDEHIENKYTAMKGSRRQARVLCRSRCSRLEMDTIFLVRKDHGVMPETLNTTYGLQGYTTAED